MERARRVSTGRRRLAGMMRAKDVLDDAVVHTVTGLHALFGIDEKTLAADGAADIRGESRLLR